MKFIVIERIFVSIVIIYLGVYLLYRLGYKKSFLPTQQEDIKHNVDPIVIEWRNKHAKLINGLILTVLLAMLIAGIYAVIIPFGKDFKYVISNKYPEFQGVIVNDLKKSSKIWFGQEVIIRNGKEEIRVDIVADNLQKGDSITVFYLPNSKAGVLSE